MALPPSEGSDHAHVHPGGTVTRVEGDQFSHRGRGLLLIGVVWVLLGVSILTLGGNGHMPAVLTFVPATAWGVLWVITGATGVLAAAFGAATRPTAGAFAALVVPPTIWATSDTAAAVLHVLGMHHGDPYAWIDALRWVVVILIVLHEASAPVVPARPPSDIGPL